MWVTSTYLYKLAKQVFAECFSFSKDQLFPLIIAIIGVWLALRLGLLPVSQRSAAYEVAVYPFGFALALYLLVQIARAPYALRQAAYVEELELYRERKWRPLKSSEKDSLVAKLMQLGSRAVGIGYNDKPDCSDLADDLAEVFRRAKWNVPVNPGVSYSAVGAKGVATQGKAGSDLASLLKSAIADATYVKPHVGEQLPDHAHVSELVNDKPIDYPMDAFVLIGIVPRRE
jgi:hypothetical protein